MYVSIICTPIINKKTMSISHSSKKANVKKTNILILFILMKTGIDFT